MPATTAATRDLHTPEPPGEEFIKIFEEGVKRPKIGSPSESTPNDSQNDVTETWKIPTMDPMLLSTSCQNFAERRPSTEDQLPSQPSQTETQVWGAEQISPAQHVGLEEVDRTLEDILDICEDFLGNVGSPPAPSPPRRNTVIIKHKQRDCIQTDGVTKVETLQTWEKEEGNEAGIFLLANFPFFVVALMALMVMVMMLLRPFTDIYDCMVPRIKSSWILYGGENFLEQDLTYT